LEKKAKPFRINHVIPPHNHYGLSFERRKSGKERAAHTQSKILLLHRLEFGKERMRLGEIVFSADKRDLRHTGSSQVIHLRLEQRGPADGEERLFRQRPETLGLPGEEKKGFHRGSVRPIGLWKREKTMRVFIP